MGKIRQRLRREFWLSESEDNSTKLQNEAGKIRRTKQWDNTRSLRFCEKVPFFLERNIFNWCGWSTFSSQLQKSLKWLSF